MKLLNKTQTEQLSNVLSFYKKFYICNICGSVYGCDYSEDKPECITCESARELKSRKKKK